MKNRIFLIVSCFCFTTFLSSCETFNGVFADQHVFLGNESKISKSKESKLNISSVIKISVQSVVNEGDLIGFRIEPNINNRSGQGRVFINNSPANTMDQRIKDYAKSEGFKIATNNNSYDKDLQLKLMYLDYRSKGGGLSVGLICNVAIKATIYSNRGKMLYEKWYFVSKEFDRYQYNKVDVTTSNINKAIDEIIGNIFADDAMLTQLKAR
jgi:hypothetical protein